MNNRHPSENEIQQYALDPTDAVPSIAAHLATCEYCKMAVSSYKVLFSGIKQQPRPAFSFDLSALVFKQLPKPEPRSADRFIAGFLFVFICCCIGIPAYLFRYYLLHMFTGVSSFFVYTIVASAILILSFKILKLYKKYRQQIRLINFQ